MLDKDLAALYETAPLPLPWPVSISEAPGRVFFHKFIFQFTLLMRKILFIGHSTFGASPEPAMHSGPRAGKAVGGTSGLRRPSHRSRKI